MQIAIVGTGYVGLVSGAGFAELGHDVTCVDLDAARIQGLCRGEVPFYEPQLAALVQKNLRAGRLQFTTSAADAVGGAQIACIAVGTPARTDGTADLTAVHATARAIGRALTGFTVVVTKSTVPVGTAEALAPLVAAHTTHPFALASNPEFLKEGDAVHDFLEPARVLVGADDPRAIAALRELYRGVMLTGDRMQVMSLRSAELAKYAANAMLATRISFMNEMARLCDAVGADIDAVRAGLGADPRIGSQGLFAGPGFGGSCLPKDLRALHALGESTGVELGVVAATLRANEAQKRLLGERIAAHFGGALAGKRIGLWGLAFKPETDDIRDAPALALIAQLRAAGAVITAYDPAAMPSARALLGDAVALAPDAYAAAEGADALVLVTEWRELRRPDYARLRATMRTPALFDGRNVWSPDDARAAGCSYAGVGRGGQAAHTG